MKNKKNSTEPVVKLPENQNTQTNQDPNSSRSLGLGNVDTENNSINTLKKSKKQSDKTSKPSYNKSSNDLVNDIGVSHTLTKALDRNIKGGGVDSDGRIRTVKGQTIDAIIKPNDYSDSRPLDVIADDLEATKSLDEELSFEQQKAQVLTNYTAPSDEPQEPILTVSDIESETNALLPGLEVGDPNAYNGVNNLLNLTRNKPVKYGEGAIERLGLEEYYPDINTPLQVGVYSGSIVGNNPIFVAGGGYIPFGVNDARKRALETAAANRVKQAEKIKELFIVPTAEQYQSQLTEHGLEIFNKYGEMTGWDYNMITDLSTEVGREFTKEYQNYYSNAKRFLAIQKQYEDLIAQWDGGKYVPQSAIEMAQDWQSGVFDIEYLMENPELITRIEKEMISYDNMTNDAQKLKEVMDYDVSYMPDPTKVYTEDELKRFGEEVAIVMDHSNYDILRNHKFEFIPMDRILQAVDIEVENGLYYGDKEQVKNDMAAYIMSLTADKYHTSYMEASNRSTNVSVRVGDEKPEEWSWIKDVVNNSNKPEFKAEIDKLLRIGGNDPSFIDNAFGKYMGIEPDKSTNNIDGIVPLGGDMGREDFVPIANVEVQTEDGSWMKYSDWQASVLQTKYNVDQATVDEFRRLVISKGVTEQKLQEYLITNGVSPSDAIMLSKTPNSTIQGGLSERRVTMAYENEDGGISYMTYDSEPNSDMFAYVHDYYELYGTSGYDSEGNPIQGTFAGTKFRVGYNPNYTTTASVIESRTGGVSSGLERTSGYGSFTSENASKVSNTGTTQTKTTAGGAGGNKIKF